MSNTVDRVVFFRDEENKVRWHYKAAGNSKVLADSAQGYAKRLRAYESATQVVARLITFEPGEAELAALTPEGELYRDYVLGLDPEGIFAKDLVEESILD